MVKDLHTLSIMCVTRRSEMPGHDSSAKLKAFSNSSMAPTPPPLARRFSFSWINQTGVWAVQCQAPHKLHCHAFLPKITLVFDIWSHIIIHLGTKKYESCAQPLQNKGFLNLIYTFFNEHLWAYLSENGRYQSRQALGLRLPFHWVSWLDRDKIKMTSSRLKSY